jgi:hypothetical protein
LARGIKGKLDAEFSDYRCRRVHDQYDLLGHHFDLEILPPSHLQASLITMAVVVAAEPNERAMFADNNRRLTPYPRKGLGLNPTNPRPAIPSRSGSASNELTRRAKIDS